jgi:hypothetical protein
VATEFAAIWVAAPATGVIAPLVPVNDPASLPVTVYAVPATVGVNVTVAIPLPVVVLVDAEKLPPVDGEQDHVTTLPDVGIGVPSSELSCAEMVTPVPATGEEEVDVTMYLSAATGTIRNAIARKSTTTRRIIFCFII